MTTISSKYNMGRFVIDNYEFQHGGDGDIKLVNFINDIQQGFGVPAKSLYIQNHGGGAGDNYLYYRSIHSLLGTSKSIRIYPDEYVNYSLGECLFYGLVIWSSNANLRFSLDATPGEWTDKEVDSFIASPIYERISQIIAEQELTSELVV